MSANYSVAITVQFLDLWQAQPGTTYPDDREAVNEWHDRSERLSNELSAEIADVSEVCMNHQYWITVEPGTVPANMGGYVHVLRRQIAEIIKGVYTS